MNMNINATGLCLEMGDSKGDETDQSSENSLNEAQNTAARFAQLYRNFISLL